MTLVDIWRPGIAKTYTNLLYNTILVITASLLVALSAQIAIPLPFTPVPVTAQILAVLLIGAVLGSARGALAILTYLAEGAAGLPVFAGGKEGLALGFYPFLIGDIVKLALATFLLPLGWKALQISGKI